MINFYKRNWYNVGGVIFIVLLAILTIFWNEFTILQRLMVMSFMAVLFHEFEEYSWPGGFPAIYNTVFRPDGEGKPELSPLNRKSAIFANIIVAYPFYFFPILFPHTIWLGLAPVLFGMAQIVLHGIMVNIKMRTIYNPGLFSVIFIHWPIGIYYIVYVVSHGLVAWWVWPVAVLYMLSFLIFGVSMPVTNWLNDKNSKNAFSEQEMNRFHMREKLATYNK